jgi:16S rRNA (cytosine967-C5)-methyltransferase
MSSPDAKPRGARRPPASIDPRRLSLAVLGRLDTGDLPLDHILDNAINSHPDLGARDRALLHAIVYGVTRWRGQLDWMMAHLARQRPEKLSPRLRNLLRMGLFQICHLDRVPPAAAVNTSVRLAKAMGEGRKAGFVNGLLRNAVRRREKVPLPDPKRSPDTYLAVRHALPRWLVRRWLKRFGFEETADLGTALLTRPPITVRANALRTTPSELAAALSQEACVTPSAYTPLALRLTAVRRPPASWPAIQKGACQVQDEAAQLVGDLMAAAPGETVLDACAGLGGKTGHLGQMMRNQGRLIAADLKADKLARLAVQMRRLGVTNVETCALDLERSETLEGFPRFDRILLDAPCSGLGVLRRNPDTKWRRRSDDLARYQARQQRMLAALATRLRPGGRLVYAVCSMEPEENAAVIDHFLNSHPDFDIDKAPGRLSPAATALMDSRGALATYPHRHGMDGFYMVALKRLK